MKKRILSLLLALVIVLGMLPVTAYAERFYDPTIDFIDVTDPDNLGRAVTDGNGHYVDTFACAAKQEGYIWLEKITLDSAIAWSTGGSTVPASTVDKVEGTRYVDKYWLSYENDGRHLGEYAGEDVDINVEFIKLYDIKNQCYVEPTTSAWFTLDPDNDGVSGGDVAPVGMYVQEYCYDVWTDLYLEYFEPIWVGFPSGCENMTVTMDGQTLKPRSEAGTESLGSHTPGMYWTMGGYTAGSSGKTTYPCITPTLYVNSPVRYAYDVKPVINSVTVNGESVADGATYVSNSKSVTVKTTYDSVLSQALQDYGCTVKYKTSLNGVDYSNVTTSTSNGNGTSTQTYVQNVNSGSSLTFKSWLEVTWPNGSKDVVDERTTVVECRSLGFASQNPKMPGESTTAARETLRLGASKTYSFTAEALSANSPYSLTTGIVIYNETENKTVYSSAGDPLSRSLDISDYITETGKYYVMEEIVLWKNGERIDALRHIFPLTIVKEALPSVAANVTVPVFEGTPSDAVLSSESQSDCTITKTEWYKRDTFGNETKIDSTHSFEVNGRYRCYVTFAPVAGTYFSSATAVYINGEKATLSGSIGDTATYYVTYDVDTDNLPVLLTDDSFPKTGSSMTVDIEAMAELSEDIMEAYFNGEISVEWYVDGTRVESAPTSDFGEKLEVKAEYNGKEVYAKFIYGSKSLTGKTYTITGEVCTIGFDANGGSNASAHSAVALNKGSAYTLPECKFTAPAGYVFKAWEVNGVEYAPGAQITVNDNVTAVAVWEEAAVTYTVYFFWAKGDEYTDIWREVEAGQTVAPPEDFAPEGFLGWYTEDDELFDFSTPIKSDLNLYAKFEDISIANASVSGTVTSFNSNTDTVTIQLIEEGHAEVAYEVTTTGNSATYSITDVVAGTYTMKVSKNNHVTREYTVTVGSTAVTQNAKIHLLGDINGDGKVTTIDFGRANAHAKGTSTLTGYELLCADTVKQDGLVTTADAARINAHARGTSTLW